MSFITKSLNESRERLETYEDIKKEIEQVEMESKFYYVIDQMENGNDKVFLLDTSENIEKHIKKIRCWDQIKWNNHYYHWVSGEVYYDNREISYVLYTTYYSRSSHMEYVPHDLIDSSQFTPDFDCEYENVRLIFTSELYRKMEKRYGR